jgi:rhamnogalacturonan acetylesterase
LTFHFCRWGFYLHEHVTIPVVNLAINGRSTRSFIREGSWKKLLAQTSPGDIVIIEMGHNDNGDPTKPNEHGADRRTLKGTGENSATVKLPDGGTEKVYTFGHYLRTMVADVKERRGIPVLSGMVPTNSWQGDKFNTRWPFAEYTQEVAKATGVEYVDHTKYSVQRFGSMGPSKSKSYFPNDNTHTNPAGAKS